MTSISGFTMFKNAEKLYYPIKASITSILPIVDEFIVAIGDNDSDDASLDVVKSINSRKIKIIRTVWDVESYPNGTENAHQTDIAKEACNGDWCFYLQADEVIHENDLSTIKSACNYYLNKKEIEGLLFDYLHFFGDYNHYNNSHGWYPKEIRIVRNLKEIHSFNSAQSFRRIPNFDGKSYRKKDGSFKLKVAKIPATVYHYGWVRPPHIMQKKTKALDTIHHGKEKASKIHSSRNSVFDYGNLNRLPEFKGSHPKVMTEFVKKHNWSHLLNFNKEHKPNREPMKHEELKNRILTFIEQRLLNGRYISFNNNWILKDSY